MKYSQIKYNVGKYQKVKGLTKNDVRIANEILEKEKCKKNENVVFNTCKVGDSYSNFVSKFYGAFI
jgi:hypothetical protein